MRKIIPVIAVILLVAGFMLVTHLGSTVKAIIETAGTQALGSPVHVSGLDISLADKAASMSGLTVANPRGFKAEDLLKAKSISVSIGDVVNKTITIKEIVVDGMTVDFELSPNGTNFDLLQKNMRSAPVTTGSDNNAGGKNNGFDVIIQQIKIINAQVIPTIGGMGTPVNLPDIVLNNIGSKNSPATPVQVATQIMGKVITAASGAALKSGLTAAPTVGKAQDMLKGLFSK